MKLRLEVCSDSVVVLQEGQQEQRLLQRTEEHQTAVNRVEEVREEEHRLRSRVKVITELSSSPLQGQSSQRRIVTEYIYSTQIQF